MGLKHKQREGLMALQVGDVQHDAPLAEHCLFAVGGPADALVTVNDSEALLRLVGWCKDKKIDWNWLDDGPANLAYDDGVAGVVLRLGPAFAHVDAADLSATAVRVGAQTMLSELVDWAAGRGLSGAEPYAGQPGTVGAALRLNIGSRAARIGALVRSVTFMESDLRIRTLAGNKVEWGAGVISIANRAVLLEATLELAGSTPEAVSEATNKAAARRNLHAPDFAAIPSLGGLFRDPPDEEPAAQILDESNFTGLRLHKVQVAENNSNYLVNLGGARAKDVAALMNLMRDRVKEARGIVLEPQLWTLGLSPQAKQRKKSKRGWR